MAKWDLNQHLIIVTVESMILSENKINNNLVGGFNPSEKNILVSWDYWSQ